MKIATGNKTRFIPVAILKNGVVLLDGNMVYTDARDRWLYVSEDGAHVYMYNNVADLIRELYKRNDDNDFVITGWDMEPYRFTALIGGAYNYYSARFEE